MVAVDGKRRIVGTARLQALPIISILLSNDATKLEATCTVGTRPANYSYVS